MIKEIKEITGGLIEWYAVCEKHGILGHSDNAVFMEGMARIHKKECECKVFIGYEVAIKRIEG
jgi:hypothetical protein